MSEARVMIQRFCSEFWWLVLLRGIAVFVLGFLLITRPAMTAVVLVQFLGAYFLIGIVTGLRVRKEVKGEWAMIAGGVMAILFGII